MIADPYRVALVVIPPAAGDAVCIQCDHVDGFGWRSDADAKQRQCHATLRDVPDPIEGTRRVGGLRWCIDHNEHGACPDFAPTFWPRLGRALARFTFRLRSVYGRRPRGR